MSKTGEETRKLRKGFSTGTAATAAAVAALRRSLTGVVPRVIAVRLPDLCFLPVDVCDSGFDGHAVWAGVVKDGGDDPDVTHKALVQAFVRILAPGGDPDAPSSGIRIVAGTGVGVVTKAGLPVGIGEPAVNPVPREMIARNLAEEILRCGGWDSIRRPSNKDAEDPPRGEALELKAPAPAHAWITFPDEAKLPPGVLLEVEVRVPEGEKLARHTLNPRLGILGGISILGTTGIVKPFSHKAYEETIQAALSVAAANGCREVVLTTGGKSERYAKGVLPESVPEAFIQIADFFAFAVREACGMGFQSIVHAAFFGKVVKMAAGREYTHAHVAAMDLKLLDRLAGDRGHSASLRQTVASANTARHALELLLEAGAMDVVRDVSMMALEQSARIADVPLNLRLLLFDYDGRLLMDCTR